MNIPPSARRADAASDRQTANLGEAVAWLEDYLRDTRASVSALSSGVEQAQARIGELASSIRRMEEAAGAILPRLTVLPEFGSQIQQTKDAVAHLQEGTLATDARLAELKRQVDATTERDRQTLNDLSRRLDAVERGAQGTASRFEAIEESVRRGTDAVTLVRQRGEEIGRVAEAAETRLARLIEASARVEHEFTRISGVLEELGRQDEQLAERLLVYVEMIRRVEQQISAVAADVVVKHDVIEKLELQRVEISRVEQRAAGVEASVDRLQGQDDEFSHQIGRIEGQQKGFQDRLNGFLADFAAYRVLMNDQFLRLHQLQERLKRKQIEEMERELREWRGHAFRPIEEP